MIHNLPLSYWWLIKKHVEKFKINTILDLGCGKGAFGDLINNEGQYKITGVDVFEPYLKVCKDSGKYEKVIKRDLTRKLPFKDRNFDMVVCLQTIEHLTKKSGIFLLEEIERIAFKTILISVPNDECLQEEYDSNKYQRHLSKWEPIEFEKRGYQVNGIGLKLVYGTHSHVGDKIPIIKLPLFFISFVMNPLAFFYPNFAAQLVAIKVKNEG